MTFTQKYRSINGYMLSEALYPPKLKQNRHTHAEASFSFVLGGNYVENYGRKTEARQPSTTIFHPPQESHAVDFQSGARILSVQFSRERFNYINEHSTVLDNSVSLQTETIRHLGNKIFREFRQMDTGSALAIEGLVLEILAEATRSKVSTTEKKSPRWLNQTRDFLEENFTEQITLEEIAKLADVHPVHLSRVFREKFDCTIGEYVRRLRVEFAWKQIASTENSLSEIAHAAGFADQSHLTKIFKTVFGLTPAEHRKSSRRFQR